MLQPPMNEVILPRFPMGLTDLSVHLEDVAIHFTPVDKEDYSKCLEVYKELLNHESWVVVEGALYGLHSLCVNSQSDIRSFLEIIREFQYTHPSKVIRAIVKTFTRTYSFA